MKSLNNVSFDKNIRSAKYAAVLFLADACGPSRLAREAFCSAAEGSKNVSFFTVNADAEPTLAKRCGVDVFPAVLLFANGNLKLVSYGISGKKRLDNLIVRLTQQLQNQ